MTESPGKAALAAAGAELAEIEAANLAEAEAAEAVASADGGAKKPPAENAEKPKGSKKAQVRGQADSAPAPDEPGTGATFNPMRPYIYDAARHITRTLVPIGQGWNSQFVQADEADFAIGKMFSQGWEPIRVRSLGYTASGINMIWVLGHVRAGRAKYSEAKHITRIITGGGLDSESISGFRADEYITSFIAEGWEIVAVDALSIGPEGLTMIWVLAR